MVKITYIRSQNIIEFYDGNNIYKFTAFGDVNLQCRNLLKGNISKRVLKLCNERLHALKYVDDRVMQEKRVFFTKVSETFDLGMRQPTWKSYLQTTINQMMDNCPSEASRYYKNYIIRMNELKEIFKQYVEKDKYYTEKEVFRQMNLLFK
jgi:hypothetical protein